MAESESLKDTNCPSHTTLYCKCIDTIEKRSRRTSDEIRTERGQQATIPSTGHRCDARWQDVVRDEQELCYASYESLQGDMVVRNEVVW